jgi:hypothetical protein
LSLATTTEARLVARLGLDSTTLEQRLAAYLEVVKAEKPARPVRFQL